MHNNKKIAFAINFKAFIFWKKIGGGLCIVSVWSERMSVGTLVSFVLPG